MPQLCRLPARSHAGSLFSSPPERGSVGRSLSRDDASHDKNHTSLSQHSPHLDHYWGQPVRPQPPLNAQEVDLNHGQNIGIRPNGCRDSADEGHQRQQAGGGALMRREGHRGGGSDTDDPLRLQPRRSQGPSEKGWGVFESEAPPLDVVEAEQGIDLEGSWSGQIQATLEGLKGDLHGMGTSFRYVAVAHPCTTDPCYSPHLLNHCLIVEITYAPFHPAQAHRAVRSDKGICPALCTMTFPLLHDTSDTASGTVG